VAKSKELVAASLLASVMWFTLAMGQLLGLQWARRDLPKDQCKQPELLRGCRFFTLVWAWLMSLAMAVAILWRSSFFTWPEWANFDASLAIFTLG